MAKQTCPYCMEFLEPVHDCNLVQTIKKKFNLVLRDIQRDYNEQIGKLKNILKNRDRELAEITYNIALTNEDVKNLQDTIAKFCVKINKLEKDAQTPNRKNTVKCPVGDHDFIVKMVQGEKEEGWLMICSKCSESVMFINSSWKEPIDPCEYQAIDAYDKSIKKQENPSRAYLEKCLAEKKQRIKELEILLSERQQQGCKL